MATSQREIFNKFKAVQSAQSLPAYESPVSRSMDNMQITDFLFEMIKQTKGQEGLKNVVLKSTLGELNNSANISNTVFNVLREVFFCFFDIIIPVSATTDHDGFNINISEIDITNMLSTDPNSPEGRHLYEGNDPQKHLNYLIYTAFSSSNEGNAARYIKNNKILFTLYYLGGNEFKMHIGAEYAGRKLSEWAEDYLQDISFFNMPNFIAELVDVITGVVSIKTGQSRESIAQMTKIQKVMQKLFGFCKTNQDTSGAGADNTIPDENGNGQVLEPINVSPTTFLQNQEDKKAPSGNLFDFSPDDILNIEDIANLLSQGKVRFATCGNFEMKVNPDDLFAKLDKLFADALHDGTVPYPNPDDPTQTLQAQKYDNESVVPDINNTTAFIDDIMVSNLQQYANNESSNEQGSPSANDVLVNMPNMEVEFQLSVIKAIPFALTQLIISPQLMLLIKTASMVIGEEENNGVFTIETVVNKLEVFITKIGNDIWNSILHNIFNILIKELGGILSGLVTKYLTQRFSDYIGILSFIINLIKGLNLSASGCQSMLDIIMRLLSLNYFGPALPVPPPLVYVGGMLKPGLNSVSVVNDLKAGLADKGIETGAYMSDGTPNYLMAAMEVQTNTLIKHVKQDSRIDVMVNGITGPAIGYAQLS